MANTVAVIGGAGRTGRLVVSLLREQAMDARVLSRDPQRARRALPADVGVCRGDVREPDTLPDLLQDVSGAIVIIEPGLASSGPGSPEATVYQGVRNILSACRPGPDGPRVVLVSQIYVTRKDHSMNRSGRLLDWRLAGEDAVRQSGFPYTVVRPGWLTNEPGGSQGIRLEQGDTGDGSVSRADIAQVCVQALRSPSADRLTFEVFNESGSPPGDWERRFAGLLKD